MDIETRIKLNDIKYIVENGGNITANQALVLISIIDFSNEENALLQSLIDEANAQEPAYYEVENILHGDKEGAEKSAESMSKYRGHEVKSNPLFSSPIPAQQSPAVPYPTTESYERELEEKFAHELESPAVAVPEIFRKVIFEQPDEAKELVIGVDDNDCPYFILGTKKFRLDPTVIENRDHAKWYQNQLSIAFEKLTAGAHIQPSLRITEQDELGDGLFPGSRLLRKAKDDGKKGHFYYPNYGEITTIVSSQANPDKEQ